MDILKSIFLGLIQGATEFLPVSSSGHLAMFKHILKMEVDNGAYFDVLLHLGTLVAVIIVFREDIGMMIKEFFMMIATCFANLLIAVKRKQGDTKFKYLKVVNSSYRKIVLMVIISTIPTGILGILGQKIVDWAEGQLWFVGICLIITAALLFVADRKANGTIRVKDASYSSAIVLGVAQGMAIMPGLSRSGATISTGLLLGYNKKLAIKYSFIMSIPAILGAVVVKIAGLKGEAFGSAKLPGYIIGTIVAGVAGFFSIKFMIRLIKNKKYIGFSIYTLVLGLVLIGYSIFVN